jgi:hypothetical protein
MPPLVGGGDPPVGEHDAPGPASPDIVKPR